MGGALSGDERQTPPRRLVQPRLDGQRDAAGARRAGRVPGPAGDLAFRRWRLLDADGRRAVAAAAQAAGEAGRAQQRVARLRRHGDEGGGLSRHRHGSRQSELRGHGRGDRHSRHPRRGSGGARRQRQGGARPRRTGATRRRRRQAGTGDAAQDPALAVFSTRAGRMDGVVLGGGVADTEAFAVFHRGGLVSVATVVWMPKRMQWLCQSQLIEWKGKMAG